MYNLCNTVTTIMYTYISLAVNLWISEYWNGTFMNIRNQKKDQPSFFLAKFQVTALDYWNTQIEYTDNLATQ
jgi:hypothetical protein